MKKLFLFIILNSYFLIPNIFSPVFAQIQPLPVSALDKEVVEIHAFEIVFNNILTVATSFFGLIAFIIIIKAGFDWMTSGGDPKKLEASKHTLTYILAGFALLIVIWLVLKFIKVFTGIDITIFKIPK